MPKNKNSKAEKKRGLKLAGFFFIGAFVISAVILIISTLVIASVLYLPSVDLPPNYSVSVGRASEKKKNYVSYSLKPADAVHGDEEYIDFTMLADKCRFPVTGDGKTLKYKIISTDGNPGSMVVCPEDSCITVNGISVPVKNGIYVKGGKIFIPCSFLEDYISGISIEKDKREIKIVLDDDNDNIFLTVCNDGGSDTVDISDI